MVEFCKRLFLFNLPGKMKSGRRRLRSYLRPQASLPRISFSAFQGAYLPPLWDRRLSRLASEALFRGSAGNPASAPPRRSNKLAARAGQKALRHPLGRLAALALDML